jgi:hypothetical protein
VLKSSKERLEVGNDSANEIRHMVESFQNRLTSDNLRLVERYVNSELKILVSGCLVCRSGEICHFLAEYQRSPVLGKGDLAASDSHAPITQERGSSQQEPVLVNTVEIMDFQQCPIISCARLYSEESFFRAWPHALYFSLADGRCILLGTIADRKVGTSVRSPAASLNELPSKMIQRTSQIVDCISNEKRNFTWNGFDTRDVEGGVLDFGYRVRLCRDGIGLRFAESPNANVQISNVLFGPFNFEQDVVDSTH